MPLATRYEVNDVERRHGNFLNEQLINRELLWIEAINKLSAEIFSQCLQICVPRELNLKTFNAFDPWGGVDVCENFMINVFISNNNGNNANNTNNANNDQNDDSGLTDVISLVSSSSTIDRNRNENKYIYCLEYANGNQTLKDALESKSITTSLHISLLLENAGFHKAWAKRHSSTPSLFFWRK